MLQFTFEKNSLLCKKREKITCGEEKSQPPPPWISNGLSLIHSHCDQAFMCLPIIICYLGRKTTLEIEVLYL